MKASNYNKKSIGLYLGHEHGFLGVWDFCFDIVDFCVEILHSKQRQFRLVRYSRASEVIIGEL